MNPQELIDLALNARLDHWPPHLGVKTDAEKIEYLATELDEAATQIVYNETLANENAALREEVDDLQIKVSGLEDKLRKVREAVA